MKRFLSRRHAAFLPMVMAMAIAPTFLSSAMAQESCKLTDAGTGTVASVRDGRTLLLADGRELRLAAIEATDDGRDALQFLVGKRDLRLKKLGLEVDRYGRLVAFAFADNSPQSVQQALLEQGRARVSARIGSKGCADLLLTAERAARAARRGLWADPNFAPLRSENLARIAAARGQFALVEGKVLSVRESGATIYLNFGRRWTHDFTVTILKRHRRAFATAGIDPKRLEGYPIRVRGWVEQHSGPVIEAAVPEQIEFVE
jgi:endonuclease YncB( thermonuclease family)